MIYKTDLMFSTTCRRSYSFSICVLNLASSNLESLFGPADSSSSTGDEQKVHLRFRKKN